MRESCYTNFRPSVHGFRFINSFQLRPSMMNKLPFWMRLLYFETPFSERNSIVLGFGPGMCLAAMDYYLNELDIPPYVTSDLPAALLEYLISRTSEIISQPLNIIRISHWMTLPDRNLSKQAIEQLDRLCKLISPAMPVPIVIISAKAQSVQKVGRNIDLNKVVLVIGYERDTAMRETALYLYDPNHPTKVPILKITEDPAGNVYFQQSTGEPVCGFFIVSYRRRKPPILSEARSRESKDRSANVWSDAAIHSVGEDRFGYMTYARALAGQILDADTPLTIAIHGPWGSGKTSLMHLLEGIIQKRQSSSKKIYSLWIDAWTLSNQDEVWQAFLQVLLNEVNRRLPIWQRIDWRNLFKQMVTNSYRLILSITPVIVGTIYGTKNANWEDVLQVMAHPTSADSLAAVTGAFASYGLFLWTIVKPAVEKGKQIIQIDLKGMMKFSSFAVQISELMKLRSRFDTMVSALVGKNGRIVVFIDDLDRCRPDKVVNVLEAVKLFANSKGCVYVLGIDQDIVRESIQDQYQYSDPRAADDYISKIIQIPFYLPPLDSTKVIEFISDYYPELQKQYPSAAEVFSTGLERNPRKVKRGLNIFRTQLELTQERFHSWDIDTLIDRELLAKMIVLKNRFPSLYDYLVSNPEFLCDIEDHAQEWDQNEQRPVSKIDQQLFGGNAKDGLIIKDDLKVLVTLLRTGASRFWKIYQENEIADYIYLSSSGRQKGSKTASEERKSLLGSDDEAKQLAAVDKVMTRAGGDSVQQNILRENYIARLQHVQDFYMMFEREEIKRAADILKLFRDWKPTEKKGDIQ
jgi:energy-coupling factor transporter ATP-binding protein EcfA2